ncbi:MAG: hypothetical protein R3F56_23955 [Planctomycetota bacterium]
MIVFARALAVLGLLFFGGALLTAATDVPLVTCRIQYRYVGLDVDARCAGECPTANCTFVVSQQGQFIVYSCVCDDGSEAWCPGVLIHDNDGIGPTCTNPYEPCGWHMESTCWPYFNPDPTFANACNCEYDEEQ